MFTQLQCFYLLLLVYYCYSYSVDVKCLPRYGQCGNLALIEDGWQCCDGLSCSLYPVEGYNDTFDVGCVQIS